MIERYYLAASLEDAVNLLGEFGERTKIIAGGTDLVLELEKGSHKETDIIVDISRIPGLDRIEFRENGMISIGALVTHNQVVQSEDIWNHATCLAEACLQVGSPQIRNRGTVVGNLVTASPANDTISALVALDAIISIVSRRGPREIRLIDFYKGVRSTVLRSDEIIKEILINLSEKQISTFSKLGLRNAQAISLVNAAVSAIIHDSRVSEVKIAVGAVAPKIVRLETIEKKITGKPLNELNEFRILEEDLTEISPITDIRSSKGYRVDMVRNITQQCIGRIYRYSKITKNQKRKPVVLENRNTSKKMYSLSQTLLIDKNVTIGMNVNGKEFFAGDVLGKSLLEVIRDKCGLTGTKEGCSEGECGACTVFMDGKAVMACLVPAPRAHLANITTIEGVSTESDLHPVQKSFIEEGAVQCGYCTPGFIMSAVMLLEETDHPDRDQIVQAISGNLCRCTGYYKIISAIEKASLIKARE